MFKILWFIAVFIWIARKFGLFRIPPPEPHEFVDPGASVDDPYAKERRIVEQADRVAQAQRRAREAANRPPPRATQPLEAGAPKPNYVGRASAMLYDEFGELHDPDERRP